MNADFQGSTDRVKVSEIPGLIRIEETFDNETKTRDTHYEIDLIETRENFVDTVLTTFESLLKTDENMAQKRDFEFVFLINGEDEISINSPENFGSDESIDKLFLRDLLNVAVKHNTDEPLRFHFIHRNTDQN